MSRAFPILLVLALLSACGLAEDEQDEKNKTIYLNISDPAFRDYCIAEFDSDRDGRLSRYEAQRVRNIDCSGLGIETLWEITEFENLRSLDCSDNGIASLDLRRCQYLERIDCQNNALGDLNLTALRFLTWIDCSANRLPTLDLGLNASVRTLNCRANRFSSLDVSNCSLTMERVDVRDNPAMTRLYLALKQSVADLKCDAQTEVERR